MTLFRVAFRGADLTQRAKDALNTVEAAWEGTESLGEGPSRHRVLVAAGSAQQAVASVGEVLASELASGFYTNFTVEVVRDSRGEPWSEAFRRTWEEVEWETEPRASLAPIERAALYCLLDAAEPTWIVARELEMSDDRAGVISVLRGLEAQGVVYSTVEASGEQGRESEPDRWWALTDEGWDLLGLIKSPTYR